MWIHHSFTQQITSEIQKLSPCCGQSSQFATVLLSLSVLSHQVRALICTVIANVFLFNHIQYHVILNVIAEWVGDLESETGGRIGLWKVCERNEMSDHCVGRLEEMMELPSMSFQVKTISDLFCCFFLMEVFYQVATIFAAVAVVTSLLTIMCLIFMIFLKSTTVFHICGWMQILSGKDFSTFALN